MKKQLFKNTQEYPRLFPKRIIFIFPHEHICRAIGGDVQIVKMPYECPIHFPQLLFWSDAPKSHLPKVNISHQALKMGVFHIGGHHTGGYLCSINPLKITAVEDTVLYRWYEEVWNKGDVTGISRMMHPKAVLNGLPVTDKGHAGFLNFYHGFRSEYSHVHVQVIEIFVQGDNEVAHCLVTARHIATTGRVSFGGVTIARIQKGQIAEAWNYYDFRGLEQQVDALKMKVANITGEVPYGN